MIGIKNLVLLSIVALIMIPTASADYIFQNEWSVSADDIQSKPAFYDLDGDGLEEIIVSSNDLKLYVVHPNGTMYWSYTVGGMAFTSSPDVGDVDGDTDLEVVAGGGYGSNNLYVWHHDGTLKFKKDGTFFPGDTRSSPTLFNIDSDNMDEIIIGSADFDVYVLDESGANEAGWSKSTGAAVYSKPAVGNISSDGYPEIVVSSTDGKLHAWDRNGNIIAGWPVDIGGVWYGSPIIADINKDGSNEVLVGSNAGGLYVLKGDGTNLTGWPAATDQIWYSSPVVADLDGDNDLEVIIASDFFKVYAFHHDGSSVSGWPVDFSGRSASIAATPAVADVDNDGSSEVIINTKYDLLYLIDGDGTILDSISTTAWKGSPNAADIDGDGDIEVVIGSDVVQLFSISNPPPTASIISPTNGSVVHRYGGISLVGSANDDGSIASYDWTSNVNGTLGANASIDATLSVGWHNITFTVEDNNGASVNDSVQIRVNSVPYMTVVSPSDQAVFDHGVKISFNGTGIDLDGNGNISAYNWTSDINGELSSSTLFDTTGLSAGIHIITLNGIDDDGAVGSATVQVKVNAPPSSSGSSGGGSVPAGSEPVENVVVKEVKKEYVTNGESVSYEFEDGAIKGISFGAKTNAGYVYATVEVLKHTSSHVDDFIPGVVYKNINIWIGGSGYATEKNIENAEISFSVEKSWVSQYHIDESTIKLNRYHDGEWNELSTTMTGEDKNNLYFRSTTPGFSPFAITGDAKEKPSISITEPTESISDSGDAADSEDVLPKPDNGLSGFGYLAAVIGTALASLLLLRKR